MARLIDDIRARGHCQMPNFVGVGKEEAWLEYASHVMSLLIDPQMPILLIDNVADYYTTGTGQEFWSLERDFPNLAPPYPQFWCEHRLSRRIHSDDAGDTDLSAILGKQARMGVLTTALKPEECNGEGIPENAKWILWMDVFIFYDHKKGEHINGPHGAMFMCIDPEGRLIGTPWMQSYAAPSEAGLMKAFMTWLHPTLLAICFLHCKNVIMTEERAPQALAKKHHARTGKWPTRYKTLVIEPLKQILRTQGRSGEVGLAKALHICRGHFRDYREGKGLFGKYHGQFWIPSVVRGTKGKEAPPREIQVKL